MRTSSLVTISLPPAMLKASEKIARVKHMTRSELMRNALRKYMEDFHAENAVEIYKRELQEGKLKKLKGSLADFLTS